MMPRRVIRQDCSEVTNGQATAWLTEYGHVVEIQLRRVPRAALRAGWFDEDDLRAVGQMAVLEACQTYDEGRQAQIALRSWVGRLVDWRMRAAVKDAYKVSTSAANPPEWATERTDDPEWLDMSAMQTQLREAIRQLGVRDKTILLEHLAGETSAGIGKPLGVSGPMIRQRIAAIERKLQAAVRGGPLSEDDDER